MLEGNFANVKQVAALMASHDMPSSTGGEVVSRRRDPTRFRVQARQVY